MVVLVLRVESLLYRNAKINREGYYDRSSTLLGWSCGLAYGRAGEKRPPYPIEIEGFTGYRPNFTYNIIALIYFCDHYIKILFDTIFFTQL